MWCSSTIPAVVLQCMYRCLAEDYGNGDHRLPIGPHGSGRTLNLYLNFRRFLILFWLLQNVGITVININTGRHRQSLDVYLPEIHNVLHRLYTWTPAPIHHYTAMWSRYTGTLWMCPPPSPRLPVPNQQPTHKGPMHQVHIRTAIQFQKWNSFTFPWLCLALFPDPSEVQVLVLCNL